MTVALERFVRAALSTGQTPLHAEVETLSDVLLADGQRVSLTQVKRSLTLTALASAIAEAYDIISLCSEDLAERLTFQVVCERQDPGLSIASVIPARIFGEGEPYDPVRLALTLNRFAEEPIVELSSPRLALRRTLLNGGVRKADRVATDALGKIFDAFDGCNRDSVTQALFAVMSDILTAAEPSERRGGRLLTPDEFAPKSAPSAKLFSGYRPTVQALVTGAFGLGRNGSTPASKQHATGSAVCQNTSKMMTSVFPCCGSMAGRATGNRC
jgi:hypothetical protein